MTNSRRRKDRREFQRGYEAGLENRQPQPNEVRVTRGPFYEGFAKGRLELLQRTTREEAREKEREENYPRILAGIERSRERRRIGA